MGTPGYYVRRLKLRDLITRMAEINALDRVLSTEGGQITRWHMIRIRMSGCTTFGAFEIGTNRLVGMASAVKSPQPHAGKWWLEDVAVLPKFEGRGIGKVLTATIIAFTSHRGSRKLDLTSRNDQRDRAQRLYMRLGWRDRDSWLARLNPADANLAKKLDADQLQLVTAAVQHT